MTETPAPEASDRQNSGQTRKSVKFGIIVDLVLAVLFFFMGLLAQANSPTGKGPGLEMLIGLLVLLGAPALGWWLFKRGSKWGEPVVWSPIPLGILAILISIALGY